jgi:hypothetical protein
MDLDGLGRPLAAVRPWLKHPGSAGTVTRYPPVSSGSTTIV